MCDGSWGSFHRFCLVVDYRISVAGERQVATCIVRTDNLRCAYGIQIPGSGSCARAIYVFLTLFFLHNHTRCGDELSVHESCFLFLFSMISRLCGSIEIGHGRRRLIL